MSTYHYLRLRPRALLWPLGLLYSGIVVIRALSFLPVATISLWYWLILGPVALLSYCGIWIELDHGTLTHRVFFLRRLCVPVKNITRLLKGPPYGLAHTDCMYYYYRDNNGTEQYAITVLFNHDPREVHKFITDLSAANPKISVDHELKRWLEKNVMSLSTDAEA